MSARRPEPGPCTDCGATIVKRHRPGRAFVCLDCAGERMRRAALEMATKSGPAWDSWLRSQGQAPAPASES